MKKLLLLLLLLPLAVLSQGGEKILRINPAGHKGQIRDMIFDNEGNIITASMDKTIKIWNSDEGYLEREIFGYIGPGIEGAIYCMALSPDNKYLAVGGWFGINSGTQPCGNIRLYDYESGRIVKTLKMHVGAVNELRFFPSSRHLLSVDVFSTAYLWDIENNKHYTFPNFEADITDVDVYDKYIITSHKSGMINLYDIDQAKPIAVFKKFKSEGKEASCVAIAPTGDRIAVAGAGEVYLLDTQLKEVKHILYSDDPIYELNFSPNGNRLVISSCGTTEKKQRIGVIQEVSGVVSEIAVMDKHRSLVLAAGFIDNNTVVTAGALDNEIAVWDLSGEKKPELVLWITGVGQSSFSVSMKGTELAFSVKKTKNYGMSKYTQVFDFVDRDVRSVTVKDTFSYPVQAINGMTLSTSSNDEILFIKKGTTTLGQIKRTLNDGISHVAYAFLGDSLVIAAGGYGFLEIYDLKGTLVSTCVGHEETVGGIGISDDNRYLVSSSDDETIRLWKINEIGVKKTIYPALSIFISRNKEWVVWNEDGYFTSSKKGAAYVGYHLNKEKNKEAKFYPFEQFDTKFNRPDIIMQELGMVDQEIIDLYHMAYLKRLKRMGLTEADLSSDLNVPSVDIVSFEQTTCNIKLTIGAADSIVPLKNFQVLLNDVPVFGSAGIGIAGNLSTHEQTVEFDLMNGKNKIQVSAFNVKGVESIREQIIVNYAAPADPTVYLVTVGVSNYKDKNFNLEYAAKDAEDLAALLLTSPSFNNIKHKQLLNEQVTRSNVMGVGEFLAPARRNDIVIFFIAGHGVLNKALDYYYCTYDMDFLAPEKNGVAYAELETLFDQLKAIRKLLIMDTCHSGEVDKDDVEEVAFVSTENPDISFRTANTSTTIRETQGLVKTNEAVKEMFNDLRRGTGATVISSAGGAEYAMESDTWKNGLFTFCLLEGIKTKNADANKDGAIMLSELQDYISDKVGELSKGRQMPTSRFENLNLDYRVW